MWRVDLQLVIFVNIAKILRAAGGWAKNWSMPSGYLPMRQKSFVDGGD
jgi:hypothetical protein